MKQKITYHAKGICHGILWGDGECSYPARKFSADTKEELDNKINEAIKTGSIDSGMGFQKMLGACMEIETRTVVTIKGKDFTNSDFEIKTYGALKESTQDWLVEQVLFN